MISVKIASTLPNNTLFPESVEQNLNLVLSQAASKYRLGFDVVQGFDYAKNYNECVYRDFYHAAEVRLDFDFLLIADSDILWRSEDLDRLISRDLDIVGGAYADRWARGRFCAVKVDDFGAFTESDFISQSNAGCGLIEVDRVGCGFLLIKKKRVCGDNASVVYRGLLTSN